MSYEKLILLRCDHPLCFATHQAHSTNLHETRNHAAMFGGWSRVFLSSQDTRSTGRWVDLCRYHAKLYEGADLSGADGTIIGGGK